MRRSFAFLLSFPGFDARGAPARLVPRLPTVSSIAYHSRQPLRASRERDDLVVSTDLVFP